LARNRPSTGNEVIVCVLENSCGQQFLCRIKGRKAIYLGEGDDHDLKFNSLEESFNFASMTEDDDILTFSGVPLNLDFCPYNIRIFPTQQMEAQYISSKPMYYMIAVVLTFLFTVLVLALLSYSQERRHKIVLEAAVQSSSVVSSLFPAMVRERLFAGGKSSKIREPYKAASAKNRLKTFLDEGKKKSSLDSKPIADLFPYTTVMFADISGFTAWSSVREPSQVFTLLETIYRAFDHIARKRSVFKVETIGDCYVAVTGLPDPQPDHAVIMAKFATECMLKMNELVRKLERQLGPDTGDLKMRLGLHSGPVKHLLSHFP
jgi:hypothetical protein